MQFIPRLSSTSINNKHHHETRAGLGGRRQHRPARSTSDQIPCQWGPYTELSNGFPLGLFSVAGTPRHNLYSCLLAHIKAAFLSSLTETPSVVAVVAVSTCGSRQETDAFAQDSSAFLTCPRAPSLGPVAAWLTPSGTPVTWVSVRAGHEGSRKEEKVCVLAH